MRRALALTTALLLTLAACGDESEGVSADTTTTEAETTTTTEPGYPSFDDVDTYLHGYFIALEDADQDELEAGIGQQRSQWGVGVGVCENLDEGSTIEAEVERLGEYLGDTAGSVIASAVLHICDQHEDAAREWADAN